MTVIPPFVPEIIPSILAFLVIAIAMPLHWIVVFQLWRRLRGRPDLRVLRERTQTALALAIVVTIFAFIFLQNGMETPIFAVEATRLITRLAVLALAIPALRWLWLYRA